MNASSPNPASLWSAAPLDQTTAPARTRSANWRLEVGRRAYGALDESELRELADAYGISLDAVNAIRRRFTESMDVARREVIAHELQRVAATHVPAALDALRRTMDTALHAFEDQPRAGMGTVVVQAANALIHHVGSPESYAQEARNLQPQERVERVERLLQEMDLPPALTQQVRYHLSQRLQTTILDVTEEELTAIRRAANDIDDDEVLEVGVLPG